MISNKCVIAAALAMALAACSDSSSGGKCTDFCGTGNYCDSTGHCVPLACTPACGAGTACQLGQCVAVEAIRCEAAYPGCASCDTTQPTPTWVAQCGPGTSCDGTYDQCRPMPCDPACLPGTACQDGACVPLEQLVCTEAYPGCATCIVDPGGQNASWMPFCSLGSTCDVATNRCVSASAYHATLGQKPTPTTPAGPLHGPFRNAYDLTSRCVGCHVQAAADFMQTNHWRWAGPTPDLLEAFKLDVGLVPVAIDPGNIGKQTLVNNFCMGVPSNEGRCDQCHAGYGLDPGAAKPQQSARAYASYNPNYPDDPGTDSSIPLENRVDCLVCHSNPTAGYAKDPRNHGLPVSTVNLPLAAQDIVLPTRANCGACHFYAGGGDGAKLMGSSLKSPTESVDFHMGRGWSCNECHASPVHQFRGGGVHTPTYTDRVHCTTCHAERPHEVWHTANAVRLDDHCAKIACQTCHIPTFSRGQFSLMDWDWSLAGDNATCAGTPGTCLGGMVQAHVADDGVTPDPASTSPVTVYDHLKGRLFWQRNVTPAYRWYNGKATHARLSDTLDLTVTPTLGTTADDANRITLGEPVGDATNGKITPFKLARGRQAFWIDGANSYAINPNLFGPGSLWDVLQAPGYSYPAYDFDGTAGPVAPGADSVTALWGRILRVGAEAAGQVAAGGADFPRWDGTNPGYDWRYTRLYMNLNHEVAPRAQALGKAGCGDCHSSTPRIPICELYPNRADPVWQYFTGVVCP